MIETTLRERQASLARRAIFEALVTHLEAGDADTVAMDDLAQEAGVSRRTLYRYFPTRAALLGAAAAWVRDEVLRLPVEIGDEGIAASFRHAATRVAERPELARAMLRTTTGRTVRGDYRRARTNAIRDALHREVPGLGRRDLERAAPVLTYLCSSEAWITIQEEGELPTAEAQAAVEWAIESLLAQLRDSVSAQKRGDKR